MSDNQNLLPLSTIIRIASEQGIYLGKGKLENRIAYFIKTGLLPHAVRRKNPITDRIEAHFPPEIIDELKSINSFKKQNYSHEKIKEALTTKEDVEPEIVTQKSHGRGLVTAGVLIIIIALLYSNFLLAINYTPLPNVLGAKVETVTSDISHRIGAFIISFLPDSFKSLLQEDNTSNVSLPGGITINGNNISIGSSLGITTINNNLSVIGSSTVSDLSVLGFLDVSGPTTLTSLSASTLKITGAVTLGSSLLVSGPSTFQGTINGNTFTNNSLIFSGSSPSIYNSTANSSLSLDAGTTGVVNIGNSSTGDILLGGGSDHTGCTITNSNGSLNCSSDITSGGNLAANGGSLNTNSSTFNLLNNTVSTVNFANTASTINVGTNNTARTVNVGTGTAADTINIGTGGTTADTINIGGISGTNITITGNVNITGPITSTSTIQGTRLISTVATGTAPLTVSSTTQVDNLNANFTGGLTATQLVSQPQPNLVLNSDFGRRNKWMTFMPEVFSDTAGWTAVDGTLGTVASNILTAGSTGLWSVRAGLSTWRDIRVSAQFQLTSDENTFGYAAAKIVDTNNWVAAGLNSGAGDLFEIRKKIGGSETSLVSTAYNATLNNYYWSEIEFQGTTVIGKLYSSGASATAKSSATLVATLSTTVSDSGVTAGYAGLVSKTSGAASKWGGLSTGDGGVYVEGWGPESWNVDFTGTKGGQAVGFDESTDAGPIGKQWAMRSYIPAASRGMVVYNPHAATAAYPVVPSTAYSLSMYEKVSGLGGSGALLWYEGRSFTSAGALVANDYIMNDSGETSYAQKTSTVTLGSTAKTEDFYIGINYQNSTNTVKSATGTLFFDLPQFEQGSIVTPWRNAPADDDPIVWWLTQGDPTTSGTTNVIGSQTEVNPRNLSANIFLPWDGSISSSITTESLNTTTASSSISWGVMIDGTTIGSPPRQDTSATNFGEVVSANFVSTAAAGKHRTAMIFGTSGGNARASAASHVIRATRGKFDLAEEYTVLDQSIDAGTVVRLARNTTNNYQSQISNTTIDKTTVGYEQDILGIVSTAPGITLSSQVELNSYQNKPNLRPVALSGRVPVKVTSENGPIHRGDILTSSATKPGYAMKATKAGRSIGIAMEDMNGEEGKVLTFVNLSFYDPQVYITDAGTLSVVKLPQTPVAIEGSGSQITIAPQYKVQNRETKEVVERTGGYNNLFVANLKVGSLDVSEINNPLLKDIQLRLSTLELATSSGVLGITDKESSSSAVFNNLNILKRLITGDLTSTGKIQNGLLSINGLDSSVSSPSATINTITNDLYLQNLLSGGINILAGKIVIDKEGNLTLQNTIAGKKIEGQEYVVTGDAIGQATIVAGQTQIEIESAIATPASKIFVTPITKTNKQSLSVSILASGKFTIAIEEPASFDIKFNYWVVNSK